MLVSATFEAGAGMRCGAASHAELPVTHAIMIVCLRYRRCRQQCPPTADGCAPPPNARGDAMLAAEMPLIWCDDASTRQSPFIAARSSARPSAMLKTLCWPRAIYEIKCPEIKPTARAAAELGLRDAAPIAAGEEPDWLEAHSGQHAASRAPGRRYGQQIS